MTAMLPPARMLALLVPAALLAGAWGFQLIGGLPPCEMCHWQRWPHYAALVLAIGAIALRRSWDVSFALTLLAGVAILVSGGLGLFHVGVEQHWWQGPTHCAAPGLRGGDPLSAILHAKVVRCDVAQWRLLGVSLAGWNALFSLAGGMAVSILCLRRTR